MMLSGYVRNHVILMGEVAEHFLARRRPGRGDARLPRHAAGTDAERFPALHALLAAGVFDRADPPDDEFAFGLERILDGVEALVRRQTG